ncbi:MAG: sigma 54-interacting transcriptional regulator [Polyangiaceae bacterium]|nr:sigma 54-interacting transcriptional regulator [Myxococcales bacterium]MCB9584253.1 sigma 54-interacting transcriptional regulator [Polyangiaceae bacterium]MCB9608584.1 sigma 54-interacting transcriptional regulator [Polyangiaceae bacterium]
MGPRSGLVLLYADEHASLPGGWALTQSPTVIGRDEGVDLCIPVQSVSRRHAEISWEGSQWILRDLGSRNGTLLDGQRVHESPLEPGQEVRVGDVLLKYVDKHAELYAGYQLSGRMYANSERKCREASQLVGGYQMDRIASDVERIAPSTLSVMLLGESGTGKEVVARELHRFSGRRGNFCAVNCAAIPGQLLESELFGYKRGAFSGAQQNKPGLVQTAHNGTLLLDEIGDMPLEAQAKLLRVLQSKEVFPLGATAPEPVDVRIVCATHRDLWRLQRDGTFREDLFARLNEYQLRLPPLRDRKEDVFMLLQAFLQRHGRPELVASFQFMLGMLHYDWPYNVRELEAAVKRCVALVEGHRLDGEHLPPQVAEAMQEYGNRRSVDRFSVDSGPSGHFDRVSSTPSSRNTVPDEQQLRDLLRTHAGNIAAVGRELGKARMQIHRWMKRYNIEVDDYRS